MDTYNKRYDVNNFNRYKTNDNFTCPYPNCNFEGLINILNAHMNTHIQNSSENIQDFLNKRKKRFSFHSRMLLKKRALLEEWNRGERAGLKLKEKFDKTGKAQLEVEEIKEHFGKRSFKERKFHRKRNRIHYTHNEDLLLESDDESKNGVEAFKGFKVDESVISDFIEEKLDDNYISDEDDWECENVPIIKFTSALSSLCNYESDSEEECVNKKININDETLNNNNDDNNIKPSKRKLDIESRTTKRPKKKHIKAPLLQKLLLPQIIHERNVILQCALHILKNNFFDS